jgi:glutaredoxin-related protein
LTQGMIAIGFTQNVVGFCSCFPYFETEINTNSLLLYLLHTTCDKRTTHLITKPVIKTKWNIWPTWNKMDCITNSQVIRSLKQYLTWPSTAALWHNFRNFLGLINLIILNNIRNCEILLSAPNKTNQSKNYI